VIVGDNETRLSVRLFSDVAQGRGHVAPLDIVSVYVLSAHHLSVIR